MVHPNVVSYDRGPRVRARPCCFTHASRLLRKEDRPREGERGRRARAVPERPRSFLSYPENRSLRHAALDDRHRITRVHHRIDRRSNLHRATLFHARTYTRAHTRTRTHTTYTTFRCCALNFRSRAPIPFRSSSFPLICLSYSYSSSFGLSLPSSFSPRLINAHRIRGHVRHNATLFSPIGEETRMGIGGIGMRFAGAVGINRNTRQPPRYTREDWSLSR